MQAVRQLDQQDADVARDGDEELAEVLRLLGFLGDEIEALDLGEALDQRADLLAEFLVDLGARDVGVLDHVVQQRGSNGGVVELELGQDRRDLEGMREIRIARRALLMTVRLHGVDIGAVEQRLVGAGVVFLDPLDKLVLAHHATPRGVRLAPMSKLPLDNAHQRFGGEDAAQQHNDRLSASRLRYCLRRWRMARSA